jgi:hypothetical protein
VCLNSKAYPANTCILEREHHLRPGTKLVVEHHGHSGSYSALAGLLLDHASRILVVPKPHELRVT